MSTLAATNLKHASSGSNNIVLASDGTTTIAAPSNIIKSGTAVASTSGTAIDFTGIPSWVKRITVMFDGVSTSGSSNLLVQIGDSGGIENTGYTSRSAEITTGPAVALSTSSTGYVIRTVVATVTAYGHFVLTLLDSNNWTSSHTIAPSGAAGSILAIGAGGKTLSGTLDRVRITTVNGTDTFDAGTVNLLWEG